MARRPTQIKRGERPARALRERRKLAIALSGGGHRACLFALGVLLYLVDARRNRDVTSIASVSGGSLANGAVAQSLDFTTAGREEIEVVVARVAELITRRGTLFGARLTIVYVALLALAALATLIGPWLLPLGLGPQIVVFIVALLALAWFAGLRGRVCARAFASTLFTQEGCPDRLDSICDDLDHVFCATNLQAGGHVYFTQRLVSGSALGTGKPGDIALSTVVQASAAFPGAFPISWQPTARHEFSKPRGSSLPAPTTMALVDGGVYANMADQWVQRYVGMPREKAEDPTIRNATELIVVSASAGLAWNPLRRLRLPVIGELLTLLRDKDILYNNGNALRRKGLVSQFKLAERDGEGLRGALVHITQSPFQVPKELAWTESAKGKRARAVIDALEDAGLEETDWAGLARENSSVPTTLLRLKPAVASRLLYHAYLLAMANLHVHLDFPLLSIPDVSRFERLVEGRVRPSRAPSGRRVPAGRRRASSGRGRP